jgi:hypothetical protein
MTRQLNFEIESLNKAARSRWSRISDDLAQLLKQKAVINLALRRYKKFLEGDGNVGLLSPLDRVRLLPTFEKQIFDAAEELRDDPLYAAQRARAAAPRRKMVGERIPKPVDEVIAELLSRPEFRALSPRGLWPHFFAVLDELGCKPTESKSTKAVRKDKIRFLTAQPGEECFAKLTFARIEAIVGRLRKTQRSGR